MAQVSLANVAGSREPISAVGQIRSDDEEHHLEPLHPDHKPSLSEYIYYAKLKRQAEKDGVAGNGTRPDGSLIHRPNIFSFIKNGGKAPKELAYDAHHSNEFAAENAPAPLPPTGEKEHGSNGLDGFEKKDLQQPATITVTTRSAVHQQQYEGLSADEIDRLESQRALRVAGWTTVTYLITTDILGPFNAPYAIANMGLVPGVCCYFFFGVVASMTAFWIGLLYNMLDSDRYPVRTYGDLCERLCGIWFRHFASILQSLQLIVNVGIILLSSAQSLYQVSKGHLCFSVCVVVLTVAGMILAQIRSLRNFAVIGSMSVYLNFFIIFLSMGVVCNSPPNYAVANAANDTLGTAPIQVQAFYSGDITAQINGMFNIVFAFGGAMIFPDMISEMRRPMDFWKGMLIADFIITTAYLVYGVVWYTQQGQYTQAQSFQGLAPYWAQTTCNIINIVTSMIAAGLYGNIGIKIIYQNIFEKIFGFPPLNTKTGRIWWTIAVPVYWAIAFVIGSAVPALGAMTGLVGAVCIFHFTYTFPPLLALAYLMRTHAAAEDVQYAGYGTKWIPKDTWIESARWKRALTANGTYWLLAKIFLFGLFLACLACDGMGLYGTGEQIKEAFEVGQATSFGCNANA